MRVRTGHTWLGAGIGALLAGLVVLVPLGWLQDGPGAGPPLVAAAGAALVAYPLLVRALTIEVTPRAVRLVGVTGGRWHDYRAEIARRDPGQRVDDWGAESVWLLVVADRARRGPLARPCGLWSHRDPARLLGSPGDRDRSRRDRLRGLVELIESGGRTVALDHLDATDRTAVQGLLARGR